MKQKLFQHLFDIIGDSLPKPLHLKTVQKHSLKSSFAKRIHKKVYETKIKINKGCRKANNMENDDVTLHNANYRFFFSSHPETMKF